jgi:hypothetical protein
VKPWTSSIGQYTCGIVPPHRHGHIETTSKVGAFFIIVLFAVSLAATWAIQCEYSSNGGIQWLLM